MEREKDRQTAGQNNRYRGGERVREREREGDKTVSKLLNAID